MFVAVIFIFLLPFYGNLDNLTFLYLAAVLLKQFVKKHWQEGDDTFEPPVVSSDEKVNMHLFLLSIIGK